MTKNNLEQDMSNYDFIELCYKYFLNRGSDSAGKKHYLDALTNGLINRLDLIRAITSSMEYFQILLEKKYGSFSLPNLYENYPYRYKMSKNIGVNEYSLTFIANNEDDFDWIDKMIIDHRYYDSPGKWSLSIDVDKKIMAELISLFSPQCCLEIGCANGSVLKLLNEMNINAEGVDISHMSFFLAYTEIRNKMHYGWLPTMNLEPKYDFIFGLDVFEHVNPSVLTDYIQKCYDLLDDGGFMFVNIPAFGYDKMFGEVFQVYIEEWIECEKKM